MEPQNQPANPSPQLMTESAKKCKHIPIIVILAILTIGGLGFGGYELWQNMQKNDEIKNLQAENSKAEEQKEDNDHAAVEENSENTSDYIYVGEWGIKVKIPEGLYVYDYKVKLAETTDLTWYDNASHIVLSGFTEQLVSSPTISEECYSLIITRTKGETDSSLANYDGYSYTVGTDVPCLIETGYFQEEVNLGGKQLIKEMFSDVNNYSKI